MLRAFAFAFARRRAEARVRQGAGPELRGYMREVIAPLYRDEVHYHPSVRLDPHKHAEAVRMWRRAIDRPTRPAGWYEPQRIVVRCDPPLPPVPGFNFIIETF